MQGKKKKLDKDATKGILVSFKGNRIYYIIRLDSWIAQAALVHIVERLLQDRMLLEEEKDFITDLTKPGVLVNKMLISKGLLDPRTAIKCKANRDKDQFDNISYY